ncbi:GumC family protein [Mucilaginibacter arboris]|uniref:non-specific protein-tyrosine kinase n=1 Tax=Mucilaginibacter arboris TaxID=2682090 RepID=A0A7K1SUM0_9SPHI|nr:tyrosine-protein kinase [Mucilaginibacter arboris]MVN21021.1 polysaccharide biosynthesis tyrosine autokinase [Mucilaginibacter arboris]
MYPKVSGAGIEPQLEGDGVGLKDILAKLTSNWYLFVISTFICLSLAAVYGYFASSEWEICAKILIQDQKSPRDTEADPDLLASPASLKNSTDNEIEILRSRKLMAQVVQEMQLQVRTYAKSGLKFQEIYENAPFNITITSNRDTISGQEYIVQIKDDKHYQIKNSKEDLDQIALFGQPVKLPQFSIALNKTALFKKRGKYKITVQAPDEAVSCFLENFNAQLSNKQASSIDLSLNYPNPKKGEAILNKLMQLYLYNNLLNKNSIADSTIKFINKRLATVSKQLSTIEKRLQDYKQQNNIADISDQSKALISGAGNYYKKLNELEVQLLLVQDIKSYLNKNDNNQTIPSSLTTKEPTIAREINAYNELLLQREKFKILSNSDSIAVENLNQQTAIARKALLISLASYERRLSVSKNELDKLNASFTGKIKQVTAKEKGFLDYVRQQKLQQGLSLFLLQKREEIAISKTFNIYGPRIIDPAKSDFSPFKPKKSIIYIFGLILGLILPAIYLFLKELLNIRINTKADILKLTKVPLIGEINHSAEDKNLVTHHSSGSIITEQLKRVIVNLQFISNNQKSNVVLFTSSMSGEGKSFLALNLGSTLALGGKKVVFLELDLRKPKLSENMGVDNSDGYTNYAISDSVKIDHILKPLWFHQKCFLISSGIIPPNPAELLMSPKLEKLIDELKKRFDYIIIDCPPIGVVADALLIEKLADVILYVVRQKYTYKSQLGIVNDLKQTGKAKNLYLIINDIETENNSKAFSVKSFYNKYAKEPLNQINLRSISPGD